SELMKTAPSRALVACLFFLALASSCKKNTSLTLQRAEDQTIETVSAIHSARSISINNNCGGFYEALPARYDSSAKKYPLILFIHGIGELGNGKSDLPNMLRAGLPRLINRKMFPPSFESGGHHYSFIVLAPQFKKWPSPEEVKGVLTYALKNYRIDTTRIYITGLSMGGGVTWEFTAQFGDNVAASIPICGG